MLAAWARSGLAHGLDGAPVKARRGDQRAVFGDAAFGDTKGCGYLLVALVRAEFETQDVSEFAHSDPWGEHVTPDKLPEATDPPS